MSKEDDRSLDDVKQVITICNQLLTLVDLGETHRVDEQQAVFYSVVRDSAFKLRRLAKNELSRYDNQD